MTFKNLLGTKFRFSSFESAIQAHWERHKIYQYDNKLYQADDSLGNERGSDKDDQGGKMTFRIDTPPPTVSGTLHIGHMYSYTQTDVIARYQRMIGAHVFFPIGFDDNGLPTERLIEKALSIKARDLPKDEFREKCIKVVEEYEDRFEHLFRSMGFSYDWSLKYQTVSDKSISISQMSFVDLYQKGKIYRKEGCTFWDVVDQTALAQTELEDKEKDGNMYYIPFKVLNDEATMHKGESNLHDAQEELVIATTRPEMLYACVAILSHPDDERYQKYIGKYAVVPVYDDSEYTNGKVPILFDDDVQMDKGSGLVMCCTFGDIQDTVWWKRHNLPLRSCINLDGSMCNAGFLNGLNVKDARKEIVNWLSKKNLINSQEAVIQKVKCAERSGAPVEIVVTKQWYIRVMDEKEQIIEKARICDWYPEYMRIRLENWVNGLYDDWCISRQRYFGVPFPVWYSKRKGEEGKILVASLESLRNNCIDPAKSIPEGYEAHEVEPDTDVMDTWATSAITPQLAAGEFSQIVCDLRPQAHEIIRTWAFGTIVKALLHWNEIPWRSLVISGWCLANDKTKMSKSKGNIVDPMSLLGEYGSDVIRYWATSAKYGADITFDIESFANGKRFTNKLWNAAMLCNILTKNMRDRNELIARDVAIYKEEVTVSLDKWLITTCIKRLKSYKKHLDKYDYFRARQIAEDFFWSIFCDNYLELVKKRMYQQSDHINADVRSGQIAICVVLYAILEMFAPFCPYITDALYMSIYYEYDNCDNDSSNDIGAKIISEKLRDENSLGMPISIHARGSWRDFLHLNLDDIDDAFGNMIIEALEQIRKFKTANLLAMNAEIDSIVIQISKKWDALRSMTADLGNFQDLVNAVNTRNIGIEWIDVDQCGDGQNEDEKDYIYCRAICKAIAHSA